MSALCLQSTGVSGLCIGEISQMSRFPKSHDARPKPAIAAKRYAEISGHIIRGRALAILAVLGWRANSQIADSILGAFAIAMIDLIVRPFTIMQSPSDAVRLKVTACDCYPAITIGFETPSFIARHDAAALGIWLDSPSDDPGRWIIGERLPQNVDRNSLERSHGESSKFVWLDSRAAGRLPDSRVHSRWRPSFQK
jgi:hypothetical protein